MVMFEVDSEGWIAQNKGREAWELAREAIQNAMDTETTVSIKIDTRNRRISIRDAGPGFDDLKDAYTIFGGDKGSDPTKRGRFGRGLKELVAGCQKLTVMSTNGSIVFDVEKDERRETGQTTSRGTKIIAENPEWSKKELEKVKDYAFSFWPPEGQDMLVSLKGGKMQEIKREEPDVTFSSYLETVKVTNGIMQNESRRTDVHVRDSKTGHGVLYEMGIPVLKKADFPFHVDVQQKIPMAEQRNEPDSDWLESFKIILLNHCYERLSGNQMKADWVQECIGKYSCDVAVQEAYVDKVMRPANSKGIAIQSDNPAANDTASNMGYEVMDASRMSRSNRKAVKAVCQTADRIAEDQYEARRVQVAPTPEEEEFLEECGRAAEEIGYGNVSFEMWEMEADVNGNMHQAENRGGLVVFNRLARDWEEFDSGAVGTLAHEIAHQQGMGHGKEWYSEMERILAEWAVSGRFAE